MIGRRKNKAKKKVTISFPKKVRQPFSLGRYEEAEVERERVACPRCGRFLLSPNTTLCPNCERVMREEEQKAILAKELAIKKAEEEAAKQEEFSKNESSNLFDILDLDEKGSK